MRDGDVCSVPVCDIHGDDRCSVVVCDGQGDNDCSVVVCDGLGDDGCSVVGCEVQIPLSGEVTSGSHVSLVMATHFS